MILADNETKVDLLNNEAIASTVFKLLRDRPDRPVTIGIHGDWGAGKSSVLEMIEAQFDAEKRVLCLKFNGWRFQGFEDAKIALIEGIVTGLLEKRPALTKATDAVKDVLRRIDWLKVAKKAGGLALTAFTGIPTPDQIGSIVGGVEKLFANPASFPTKEAIEAAVGGVKSVLKPAGDTKNVPEEIAEFRAAFDRLLKAADIDQLVVLIDDLDRCLPDTAIETLEAVRLFVFTPRTAFVVAADEAMIEYAVRKHFPDLPDTTGPRDYARNYLEKLIQVPLRIPAFGEIETCTYVTLLLVGAELPDGDSDFANLVGAARSRLKQPWKSGWLDAETVRKVFGGKNERALQMLNLSDQIGPILASGTQGNPRQIKRFLNALMLRKQTAEARGFGADVKLPVLAKLMLAERFLSRTFDQIAGAAAANSDGLCDDLASLEESVAAESQAAAKPSPRKAKAGAQGAGDDPARARPVESPLLADWLASDAVRAWAQVQPSLAGVDLRPYLFVAKDKKDYFGAASVLGRLAAVVERLLGSKMQVQSQLQQLRQLAPPEAGQVFEAVRARVVGSGDFTTEPGGVAGLQVLVKAHPILQPSLLDFLAGLPGDRLGVWVVKGWSDTLTTPESKARFQQLLESWKGQEGNTVLSVASAGVLKAGNGPR